ncbi:MAG: exodeoxyribonuclease-3 [Planctomycetota bacterium]
MGAQNLVTVKRATPIILALLLCALLPACADSSAEQRLRVLTLNTHLGLMPNTDQRYHPGLQRLWSTQDWIAAEQPDIVALQELDGFTPAGLQRVAAAWGHEHVVLQSARDGHLVGITSAQPIEFVGERDEDMDHGFLYVRTFGIDVLTTHLSSQGLARRRDESEYLLRRVETALAKGHEVLLLGDLNSHSAADAELLAQVPQIHQLYLDRDASHGQAQNLVDGKIDFSVMQSFFEGGLVDVFPPHRSPGLPSIAGARRIDYILASQGLASRCVNARWEVNADTHLNSDHYPVVAEFDWDR